MVNAHELNELSGRVIGAAIEVHRSLGPGLEEPNYQLALSEELNSLGLVHRAQAPLPLIYKGAQLDAGYRMDFVVEKLLILELKAVERVHPIHEAQLITYLKLASRSLGLLINFDVPVLRRGIHRRVLGFDGHPNPIGHAQSFSELPSTAEQNACDPLSRNVIGAAAEVHRELGPGLLRSAYCACLSYEMSIQGTPFERRKEISVSFRSVTLPHPVEVDFVVTRSLPLMILCSDEISCIMEARFRTQLKLGNWPFGFILNFNVQSFADGIRRLENPELR